MRSGSKTQTSNIHRKGQPGKGDEEPGKGRRTYPGKREGMTTLRRKGALCEGGKKREKGVRNKGESGHVVKKGKSNYGGKGKPGMRVRVVKRKGS